MGSRSMTERYWLVGPDGDRRPIDPTRCDLERLAERARRSGGRLIIEGRADASSSSADGTKRARSSGATSAPYEPPVSAIGALFRRRLDRIHAPSTSYELDINTRATVRVLGGYYRKRRLVRLYTHDRETGRRPLEELFDTFLHEMAHHLEYTEPQSFHGRFCGRVPGRMHSELFWRILGELKGRWADLQRAAERDV